MLPIAMMQVWVHEQADGKLDIVDGKQRITSLLSYLDGIFPRNQQRFALEASQLPECTITILNQRGNMSSIICWCMLASTLDDKLCSMLQLPNSILI